jgi:sulfur transfer complex TusBCD TusB component (DsrH family)
MLRDDMKLRGITDREISGKPIDYGQLVELMTNSDKVVGIF